MYELTFDEKAIDFLNSLPKEIKERIFTKILKTKEYPLRFFERLSGRADFKLRVGDYRVIADIEQKKINVRFIGHRKNIYKKI